MFKNCLKIFLLLVLLSPTVLQAKDPLPETTVPLSSGLAAQYNSPAYNPAYNGRTFNAVAQGHFALIRFIPDWKHIEKTRGVYDFQNCDWLISAFTSRGLRPVLGLGLNNSLYGVETRINTPEQRVAFGRFVQAIVKRYRGQKIIWEIWNEPNIPFFWRPCPGEKLPLRQQVAEYMALLDDIVPIIRKTDPEALVIGPGAANYNTAWLREVLKQGLLRQLDGLSVHPYLGKERPELVINQHRQVQSWISPELRCKPVFFTEWGYSTGIGPDEVSEQTQANYAQRQYMLSLLLGVQGNFIYSLTNDSIRIPCQSKNACYGLFDKSTGREKPAYYAMKRLMEQLYGFRFTRRIAHAEPTIYILEFKNSRHGVKYAFWKSYGKPVAITLPNGQTATANESVQVL
jgi:hypothetical protein